MHSIVLTPDERKVIKNTSHAVYKNWKLMGVQASVIRKLVGVGILEYNNKTRTMVRRKI